MVTSDQLPQPDSIQVGKCYNTFILYISQKRMCHGIDGEFNIFFYYFSYFIHYGFGMKAVVILNKIRSIFF